MPRAPRILAFAGSARSGSINKTLAAAAAASARAAGAEVTFADLRDYPMPLFDEDDEASHGMPDAVLAFRDQLKHADGFIIASPEYNGAPTAMLKNAIDWATRPREGEVPLECFTGKTALLLAASPGGLGGIRGLPVLRTILSGIGVHVLGSDVAVPRAHEAFGPDGEVTDTKTRANIERAVGHLVDVTGKIVA